MTKTINTSTKRHEGEIIKQAISQVGLSYEVIAKRMRISTSTLYRKLKAARLNDIFILKVVYALEEYDFSAEFPRLVTKRERIDHVQEVELAHYKTKYLGTFKAIEKRYIGLLKAHRKMLRVLLGLKKQLFSDIPLCGSVVELIKEISAEA